MKDFTNLEEKEILMLLKNGLNDEYNKTAAILSDPAVSLNGSVFKRNKEKAERIEKAYFEVIDRLEKL